MIAEGDLASTVDQSNKIREMQDKIAHLRAQVGAFFFHAQAFSLSIFLLTGALFLISHNSLTISNCQRPCAPPLWSTNFSCLNEQLWWRFVHEK